MKEFQKKRLEQKITEGYVFDGALYLKKGWKYFTSYFGGFVGFMFLSMLAGMLLGFIPFMGFVISTFVIGPAFKAGFYMVSRKIDKEEPHDFGYFFNGFDHVVQLALATVVMYLILGLVMTPTIFALQSEGVIDWYLNLLTDPELLTDPPPLPEISSKTSMIMLLNFIPFLYLLVSYSFTVQLIVFMKMSFWQAMETSRRVISRKWFAAFFMYLNLFGIFVLIGLLSSLIAFALPAVGVFAVIAMIGLVPFTYTTVYAAFSEVTELNNEEEGEDEIIDHLVE